MVTLLQKNKQDTLLSISRSEKSSEGYYNQQDDRREELDDQRIPFASSKGFPEKDDSSTPWVDENESEIQKEKVHLGIKEESNVSRDDNETESEILGASALDPSIRDVEIDKKR